MPKERNLFKVHGLEPPPQWDCQTQIGAGGFARVFLEPITRPVVGTQEASTQLCAVKRIAKEDVKFSRKSYEREIAIISKLKQVSTPLHILLMGLDPASDLYVYDRYRYLPISWRQLIYQEFAFRIRITGSYNCLPYIKTPDIYILPWSIWSGEILETTFIVDGMKAM